MRYFSAYDIATLLPHIWVTHVKTKDADAQGRLTSYDQGGVFTMLKKANYKGPISIEFEGQGDAIEGVRKAKGLIEREW